MRLRELQTQLPWTIHYHRDFRANPQTHKDFAHALLHVQKAIGQLSELINQAEHGGCDWKREEVDPYVSDLVVCALRMANTCPGHVIDLERTVIDRIEQKNGVSVQGKAKATGPLAQPLRNTPDQVVPVEKLVPVDSCWLIPDEDGVERVFLVVGYRGQDVLCRRIRRSHEHRDQLEDGHFTLRYLLEHARRHTMNDAEKEAQRRSFAHGNVAIDNPQITREDVDRAAEAERANPNDPFSD